MVETEKMSGKRVVFNRGIRDYHTSAGILKPQMSIELPEKEAKELLDYSDVIDFAKISPAASAENSKLKEENEKLKSQLADKAKATPEPQRPTKEATAKKRKK